MSTLRLRLSRSQREAVLSFDPSCLGAYTLRNKYAPLSNQQRKPSFKFGGSVILLLSNKGVHGTFPC